MDTKVKQDGIKWLQAHNLNPTEVKDQDYLENLLDNFEEELEYEMEQEEVYEIIWEFQKKYKEELASVESGVEAFLGDYVRIINREFVGKVIRKYPYFNATGAGMDWLGLQDPALPQSACDDNWYNILVHGGGSIIVPEQYIIEILPTVQHFDNSWESFYFRK